LAENLFLSDATLAKKNNSNQFAALFVSVAKKLMDFDDFWPGFLKFHAEERCLLARPSAFGARAGINKKE
jgi:hypothetical protein